MKNFPSIRENGVAAQGARNRCQRPWIECRGLNAMILEKRGLYMWNKDKSVILSSVCTRLVIAVVAAAAIALPFLYKGGFFLERSLPQDMAAYLLPILYAACIPAFIALILLDRLLANIRRGNVFTPANVRILRVLSWICFAAAAILFGGGFVSYVFALTGAMAAFIGLILRVVKNVFAAAVALKDENDFTI
jgi:hypothetical protein